MSDIEEVEVEIYGDKNTEEEIEENDKELEVNTKEKDLKLKRKVIKGKITRTINRIKESVKSKELTERRADKVLRDLKEDFKVALEYNGELYMFPGVDTDKLDRWEEDLTRDVYSIEEKVEDYLTVSSNPKKTEKRSSARKKKTISAIEEEVREADSSEVEETGDDVSGKEETEQKDSTDTEKEKASHDKVPKHSEDRQISTLSPSEVKSVDSWIDELTEFVETKLPEIDEIGEMSIATALFKIEARKDMPPVETPKFSGDPLDYVEFIETFKIHVHEKATLRDDQRMGHLKMALRGKAEESIKGLGSSGIMYATALKSIKREFGQSSVIVRAQIYRITRGDVIRPNDRDSLRTFSLDIINCIATLKRLDRLSDANSPEFLRQVVRKLPAYLVDRWKTRAMEIRDRGRNPDLQEISTFIQRNVRAQFDPDYGDLFRDSRPVQVKKGVNANTPVSNNKFTKSCKVCGQTDHSHVRYCSKFKSCNVEDRLKSAKEHRLCYSCLMYGHKTRDCRNKKSCGVNDCQRTHHSLLHVDAPVASGTSALDRDSILPVVRVRFRADNGRVREGNVLIDSGAGTTIIRKEFARQLGLQGKKEGLNISVVGGRNQQQRDSRRVGFWISPLDGAEEYRVEAHELDKTIAEVSQVDKRWLSSFNHLKDIKLTHREGPVDLILGVQYTHLHVEQEIREGLAFEPVAKNTRLGWVVIGSEYRNSHKPPIATIAFCMNSVQEDVKFLYEVETVGVQAADCKCPKMSLEDKKVLDFFESSFKIENDRCSIGLPWARDPSELPNNFAYAKRRLYSLEQSLDRNPVKKEAYRKVMNDYVQRGWAEEVHDNTAENVFYLPHHGVVNIEKPSTPLRVVFDSAALYQGASLNKFLHKGPSTLIDLFGILIRFREERVGFMGDISKMFLQICLPEEDTQYHRYLWRDTDTAREPSIYRLLRVTFGDKPSPEMANFVMRKLAELNEGDYPEAAEILKRDRYMDDLIHSCKSSDEAEQKMAGIDKVLAQGSFSVKEWHSSKKKSTNDKIDITGDRRVKTLGVVWCCEKDTIHFNVKSLLGADYTKRSVLSKLSMLFDPLGLASVVTIRARIAMQEIWKMKDVGWDDPLPDKMCSSWTVIFKDLEELNNVQIDRCLQPQNAISSPELHVFADASNAAYGACAYLSWPTTTEKSVKLVASKSRVAPLHQITIPRLELMAALLAARLAKTLHSEMKIKPEVMLWTDSKVVLKWIQSESTTKKPFVAVRIAEIQTTWEPDRWRYVPSKDNVADDLSRGLKVSQITDRWFGGPEFLKLPKEQWPIQETLKEIDDTTEEKKSKVNCSSVLRKPVSGEMIMDCERHSSWRKLLRITAFCFRFIRTLRNRIRGKKGTEQTSNLQPDELQGAERYWIRQAQREITDWKGTCQELSPFMENGILRVGGRLRHSPLDYDAKHPILLPPSNHITILILRNVHKNVYHAGAERTLVESRRKYWVLRGRNAVKGIVRNCVQCRKMRQPCHVTTMADLPPERLRAFSPPFTSTGVDLFGPFFLKYGRNKKIKAWGAIFTCSTVRAIHLEVVENLSTQAFLHALRRFASIHGWRKMILSDNGTSFVGTHKELQEMTINHNDVEDYSSKHGVKWKFSTPLSPHQGGIYESLIKQVKRAIQVSIGSQTLSWNEMTTVFAEVKELLNSRPLYVSPNNPDEPQAVTPNHFLIGRASADIPQGQFKESTNLKKRFEFVQQLVQHFWKRLVSEYFPTLTRRVKWLSQGRQLSVGDIVLIVDRNSKRGDWKLATVTEVYPGRDGVVRNVQLKTAHGLYRRSVQQCCLLLENTLA